MNMFYFHVALAIVILFKDHNGTLEDSLNRFEEKIGIYTPPDSTVMETDSTWVEDDKGN